MNGPTAWRRSGFTVMETVVGLAVLGTAMVLVAEVSTWSLAERTRAAERVAAIEGIANILEEARARSWADLTPEWAAGVRLPDDLSARLRDPSLSVRVEPESDRPRVKRVSVELGWKHLDRAQARTVRTIGLFADRTAGGGS